MSKTARPAPTPRTSLARAAGAVTVVLLGSIRCQVPLDPQPLQRFETCDDLQLYLEDQILHPGVEQSFETSGAFVGCSADEALRDVSAGEGEGEGDGRQFTTTTTQEEAVDEPDFVKNNGDVIFVLRRGEMIILSAWPADDMHVLSRTRISGTPFTMLFHDDDNAKRALVMSNFFTDRQRVLVKLFDVTDPTEPVELRSLLVDGDFVDARAVGSEVLLVSRSQLSLNVELDPAPFSDDENRSRLRAAGLGRILPQVTDFIVGQDTSPRVERAIACENTYAPSVSDGRNILLVHALDMADETAPLRSTGVVAGFSHVYGSTSSLYLASTERNDGGYFTPSFATTRIHKLSAFQGAGAAEYQATAVIDGTIKDELSLDEDEASGLLRIVVTDNSASEDPRAQTTSLVVLEQGENATELTEVARVDDIGRGEGVESVRFIGDKAYVVTYPLDVGFFLGESGFPANPFTDPLFVIDLADPRSPRLRGELEVGGYSAYIHPLDDKHLLTVGVNTDPNTNQYLGLSLLVFDVTDPDRPSLLHRHDFGGPSSDSEALVERHAFTYFGAENALAIPVQRFANDTDLLDSSSLAVFRVDLEQGFLPLGEIEQAGLYPNLDGGPQNQIVDRFNGPCVSVRRSVMISDSTEGAFVYAVSTGGVTASALADELPVVATVRLLDDNEELCDFTGSPL